MLSTVASTPVEEVIAARGGPVWFQLYAAENWTATQAMVKRAEDAGCSALVLTVDLQGDSNRETVARGIRRDDPVPPPKSSPGHAYTFGCQLVSDHWEPTPNWTATTARYDLGICLLYTSPSPRDS